jgi:hypothetical protein
VKTEKQADNVYIMEIPSELTDPNEKPYFDAGVPGMPGLSYLILDFSKVKHINGLGISMLVKLGIRAKKKKIKVLVHGINTYYRDVFRMTGLNRILRVCLDSAEAYQIAGISASPNPGTAGVSIANDTNYWSVPVDRIVVPTLPPEAINMNRKGRRIVGPVDGFGSLWQKTYRLSIDKKNLSPQNVIDILKKNFSNFQPDYNHFYPGNKEMVPGEVIAIDSSTPGGPVSTGVVVLYADNESITFITPQGHPESGWVTFSVYRDGNKLLAQILGLARANDPIYEIAFRTVGSKMQIRIWTHVLESLAKYLEAPAKVSIQPVCVDPAVRWSQLKNFWFNAQVRTILASPVWWIGKKMKGQNREKK